MKLKSYKVQGYPPIQGFEVSDLADIVVLAGPNGVGKTSLLTSLLTVFQGSKPDNPSCATQIRQLQLSTVDSQVYIPRRARNATRNDRHTANDHP